MSPGFSVVVRGDNRIRHLRPIYYKPLYFDTSMRMVSFNGFVTSANVIGALGLLETFAILDTWGSRCGYA